MLKQDLDTPTLLVDLDRVERTIAEMAAFFRGHGVGWRPHTKGQKVPEIAHMEIEAGALGITCAKLGEAEVMADAGIRDILIANQVVGRQKAERLAALLERADVVVAVDSIVNGEELGAAAHARGKRLRVIVEVDNGMQRAGVPPGEPTVELARRLAALPGLRFCGVMAWEAHCLGRPMDERRRCCEEAVGALVTTARQCREAGLDAEIVSCGGTGTFRITAGIEGITEIQAGGGIFSDVLYESWGIDHPFALTVMSTVTSRPTPQRIITDAGRKAMSMDIATPRRHRPRERREGRLERRARGRQPHPTQYRAEGRGQAGMDRRLRRHHRLPARRDGGDPGRPGRSDLAGARARQDQVALPGERMRRRGILETTDPSRRQPRGHPREEPT